MDDVSKIIPLAQDYTIPKEGIEVFTFASVSISNSLTSRR